MATKTIGAWASSALPARYTNSDTPQIIDQNFNPLSSGGGSVATLSGTFEVGKTVTATLPTGSVGTIQFTRTTKAIPPVKTLISGAVANNVNSLTYTIVQADAGNIISTETSNVVNTSTGFDIPIPAIVYPHAFARPAIGLFDYSDLYNRSNALTKHDSSINYYFPTTQTGLVLTLQNFIAQIGNFQEAAPANDLKFRAGIELANANGTFRMERFTFGGSDSVILQGGSVRTVDSDVLNTTALTGTYGIVKVEITAPDGTSVIQVPRYSASDYAREVLASHAGEGCKYNTVGDLTAALNTNSLWSGKVGDFIYRPLALRSTDAVVPKSAVLLGDSNTSGTNIPSGSRSFLAGFFHAANIAFINIARSGGSQLDWPTKTLGRVKALKASKTVVCADGMNGFGTGLEPSKTASAAQWAQARAEGATRVIHLTIPPNTSSGSTSWDSLEAQANQSTERPNHNAWAKSMVGQPGGPDVVWDIASVVSSPDGLKWLPNYCRDGIHYTTLGRDAVINYALANNWANDVI